MYLVQSDLVIVLSIESDAARGKEIPDFTLPTKRKQLLNICVVDHQSYTTEEKEAIFLYFNHQYYTTIEEKPIFIFLIIMLHY